MSPPNRDRLTMRGALLKRLGLILSFAEVGLIQSLSKDEARFHAFPAVLSWSQSGVLALNAETKRGGESRLAERVVGHP